MLAFFDAKLKAKSEGMAAIDREAQRGSGLDLRREVAIPPPAWPVEAAALADSRGLDAAKRAFVTSYSVASCMDIDGFNNWAYNLLGKQRPKIAVAVFELNAWAHPGSANTQDSLADGYLAVGDKENAKRAVERAILLAPNDSLLDPTSKESFLCSSPRRMRDFRSSSNFLLLAADLTPTLGDVINGQPRRKLMLWMPCRSRCRIQDSASEYLFPRFTLRTSRATITEIRPDSPVLRSPYSVAAGDDRVFDEVIKITASTSPLEASPARHHQLCSG